MPPSRHPPEPPAERPPVRFVKYEALGNDYLVIDEGALPESIPLAGLIRAVCDRRRGLGADGVLLAAAAQRPRLRIFNPDGVEAELSGNGVRIFARYLRDRGEVSSSQIEIETMSGPVLCRLADDGYTVGAQLSMASFESRDVPVAGPARRLLSEPLEVGGETLRTVALTVGNPHCVILETDDARVSGDRVRRLGPLIERHELFPQRTNVQLAHVVDPHHLRLEIWERGAGYTLSSGSSSCAAAAAAVAVGLCRSPVTVSMPGGELTVSIDPDGRLYLEGPVRRVASGTLDAELLKGLEASAPLRT